MMIQLFGISLLIFVIACVSQPAREAAAEDAAGDFQYQTEQFADLRILRYRVPGFEDLSLQQKKLAYYLYEASLSGRDIIWAQNYRHNLVIRRTLENIVRTYTGDRNTPEWEKFMTYTKRVWFSNGIHHHYSTLKLTPEFNRDDLARLAQNSNPKGFPLREGETVEALLTRITPILFDPQIDAKKVNLAAGVDQLKSSATNYYDHELTQKEVEQYYSSRINPREPRPISHGLNSKLVKENGRIYEQVWKVGGMYTQAIEKIVYWLEQAFEVAETPQQQAALHKLIEYYRTGDLKTFDEYSVLWVQDTDSFFDIINGFIEVYGDPLGFRGAYESVLFFRDVEATRRIQGLAEQAQWFEDNSPLLEEHKKDEVTGISARVVTVVVESGDASPATPIGINLPNANWIRKEYGSKSVNLANIVHAYNQSERESGVLEEFTFDEEQLKRAKEHGVLADNLHTDLHEVIGHASGQLEPGVGTPKETLKSYASTLEEARADLMALYYILDAKLVEIGVVPSLEVGRAAYDRYIRNGLMVQLSRLKPGEDLEEAHMRNRQMISLWAYREGRSGQVIEKRTRDGKTFFVINDYEKLRELFGRLLREIQRIKSQGDYAAGQELVESYGVKVDAELHQEVLERYKRLNRAPYAGFINPRLIPITNEAGEITDVRIEYPDDFTEQMLYYAENYSFLPS